MVENLSVRDFRNIREAAVDLHPGLNVFHGRNAQGKTSLLEAVGVLARGRSFRTEDAPSMIRRGAGGLVARARGGESGSAASLEVELRPRARVFRIDGREVAPREYHGRLEVVVYSTDRLRVVRGSMRDRRQFLDRQAAALWPSYRAEHARLREAARAAQRGAREPGGRPRRVDRAVRRERGAVAAAPARSTRRGSAARSARGSGRQGESYEIRTSARPGTRRRAGASWRRRSGRSRGERGRPAAAWPGRIATRSRYCSTATTPRSPPRRARRAACCWRSRSRACASTARRPAAPRWPCSTTSTRSSTSSARGAVRRGRATRDRRS